MIDPQTVDTLNIAKDIVVSHVSFSAIGAFSDLLIIIGLVLFFYGFAWYIGRGPMIAIILSYYGAYALYIAFPYERFLPSAPPVTALLAHLGLYVALGFGFYVVLRRVVVSDFLYMGNMRLILLSLFAATFVIAMLYHLFPITSFYHFSPFMDLIFAPNAYFFWWFIGPAVALFFLAR